LFSLDVRFQGERSKEMTISDSRKGCDRGDYSLDSYGSREVSTIEL
jgi:hypothetical protein